MASMVRGYPATPLGNQHQGNVMPSLNQALGDGIDTRPAIGGSLVANHQDMQFAVHLSIPP